MPAAQADRDLPSYRRDAEEMIPLTHVACHILLSLAVEPHHGYGIIKDVRARTEGRTQIEAGTLYSAIKRMIDDGLVRKAPAPPDSDMRRRYYTATGFGRRVLRAEAGRLAGLVEMAEEAGVL